jgi:hypothetical protein
VQTFTVINTFQKVFNSKQRIIAISIAIQIDFLTLQRTHEAFRDCIGRGRQLHRMTTMAMPSLKSSIHTIR